MVRTVEGTEHPRAEEILGFIRHIHYVHKPGLLRERTLILLQAHLIYSTKALITVPKDTRNWWSSMRKRRGLNETGVNGKLSEGMKEYFDLMNELLATPIEDVPIPEDPVIEPPEPEPHEPMLLTAEQRQTLRDICPEDLALLDGDDLDEAIWWYWLEKAKQSVAGGQSLDDVSTDDRLRRFADLQKELLKHHILKPVQKDMWMTVQSLGL